MRSTDIQFTNRQGLQLSAKIEMPPEGETDRFILFAHCFTCGKDIAAARNISRAMAAQGYGVMRFDFTGIGRSEGEFADSHFTANVEDLIDAAAHLEAHYRAPAVLVGHSLGGAAIVFAAQEIASVEALVTIGAPSDPEHVTHLFGDSLSTLEQAGEAEVNIGGRPFHVRKDFIGHLESKGMQDQLKKMRKALLVCHSPQDQIVEISNAAEIYLAAHHPKSFLSLDGADHLLSQQADSRYVGDMIAAWLARYAPIAPVELQSDAAVVVSLSEPGFTSMVKAGRHRMIADEPKSIGGQDFGPAPYEFVSTGLAACTAMTIRMYTDRKGWALDEVLVHVDHSKTEGPVIDGRPSEVDRFERKISIKGDLDAKQIERILVIADKCPVHRTLERSSEIKTNYLEVS